MQILARSEGDRMQQEVEAAQVRPDALEDRFQLAGHLHVAWQHRIASQPIGDDAHKRLGFGVQIGRGKPRAAARESFSTARGDAVLIGDPEDQTALAAEIDDRSGRRARHASGAWLRRLI
jgi:hypothetical protein